MSFSLILFQRKILLLISQNLETLQENLLLYTAECHHHLHFLPICMGLHDLNENLLREKKNEFLLQKSSIFSISQRDKHCVVCFKCNLVSVPRRLFPSKVSVILVFKISYPWIRQDTSSLIKDVNIIYNVLD